MYICICIILLVSSTIRAPASARFPCTYFYSKCVKQGTSTKSARKRSYLLNAPRVWHLMAMMSENMLRPSTKIDAIISTMLYILFTQRWRYSDIKFCSSYKNSGTHLKPTVFIRPIYLKTICILYMIGSFIISHDSRTRG